MKEVLIIGVISICLIRRGKVKVKVLNRLKIARVVNLLYFRGVAQFGLECLVRVQEVVGSNPVTPTI